MRFALPFVLLALVACGPRTDPSTGTTNELVDPLLQRAVDSLLHYTQLNPPKGLVYADSAMALVDTVAQDSIYDLITAQSALASAIVGDLPTAKAKWARLYEKYRHTERTDKRAKLLANLSAVTVQLADYDAAKYYGDEAVQLYTALSDTGGVISAHRNLGHAFYWTAEYEESMEHYLVARQLAEATGDSTEIGMVYGDMANYYSTIKEYERSIAMLRKRVQLARASDTPSQTALVHYNLCSAYLGLSPVPDSCLYHADLAKAYYEELGDSLNLTGVENMIALFHAFRGAPELADVHFQRALEFIGSRDASAPAVWVNASRASTLMDLGRYAEAYPHARLADSIAKALGLPSERIKTTKFLSRYHMHNGAPQLAWANILEWEQLKDSLEGANSRAKIEALMIKFDVESSERKQAEMKLALVQSELAKTRRERFIWLLGGLSLIGFGGFIAYRRNRMVKHRAAVESIAHLQSKVLRLQVDKDLSRQDLEMLRTHADRMKTEKELAERLAGVQRSGPLELELINQMQPLEKRLDERDLAVVALIVAHEEYNPTRKEIATALMSITEEGVKKRLDKLRKKLDVTSVPGIAKKVLELYRDGLEQQLASPLVG